MRSPFYCLVSCLLLLVGCAATHPAKPNFTSIAVSSPEFFPIFPWNTYNPGSTNSPLGAGGAQSVADCHFNIGGFAFPKDVTNFEKFGLGSLVMPASIGAGREWSQLSDAEIDQQIKTAAQAAGLGPAMAGIWIKDEPGVKEFPALAKAVAAVKKYAPRKLAYINLFPDYATLGAPDTSQLGTASYTDYLERFVNEVHPQLISYDNYMVEYSMDLANPGVAASYYKNMLEVRRVAQEHDLPFINIVASNEISPGSTPPSPANLMFQAYTTLAAGSQGVVWFTYYRGGFDYAPVDENDRKTLSWAWLEEVNREVVTLEPILCHLTSTGVYFSSPAPTDKLPLLPGKLVESVTCATPLMVGEFKDRDGHPYVMVVNLSMEKSAKFKFKTVSAFRKINAISAMDGAPMPLKADEGYWLTAGQGVLLALAK